MNNEHRTPDPVQGCSQRVEEAWSLDPSPRAIGTERGCVEDQPQRVGSSKASRACSVLRLVEDDTAALRSPGPSQFHRVRISGAMSNEQFDASRPGTAKHITLNPALGPRARTGLRGFDVSP